MINGDESAFLNLTKKVFFFVFFQYIAGTEGQIPAGKIDKILLCRVCGSSYTDVYLML